MTRCLFAVWDNRAQTIIGLPFMQRHDAAAIRTFSDSFKDERSGLAAHPADFDLYSLGTIADDSPTISADTRFIVNGATLMAASSNSEAPAL